MGLCLHGLHRSLGRIRWWEVVCCRLPPVTLETQEDGIQGGGALFVSDTENPSQDTSPDMQSSWEPQRHRGELSVAFEHPLPPSAWLYPNFWRVTIPDPLTVLLSADTDPQLILASTCPAGAPTPSSNRGRAPHTTQARAMTILHGTLAKVFERSTPSFL